MAPFNPFNPFIGLFAEYVLVLASLFEACLRGSLLVFERLFPWTNEKEGVRPAVIDVVLVVDCCET